MSYSYIANIAISLQHMLQANAHWTFCFLHIVSFNILMCLLLQEDFRLKTVRPEMTDDQFKQFLEETFHEYFEHGDTSEVVVSYYNTAENYFVSIPYLTFNARTCVVLQTGLNVKVVWNL